MFYGKSRQRIYPSNEPGKSEPTVSVKEDIFAQLLVNVSEEGLDLYDGLGHFLDDTVEFEGRQAEMEIDILELPPILQIQLQVISRRSPISTLELTFHVPFLACSIRSRDSSGQEK